MSPSFRPNASRNSELWQTACTPAYVITHTHAHTQHTQKEHLKRRTSKPISCAKAKHARSGEYLWLTLAHFLHNSTISDTNKYTRRKKKSQWVVIKTPVVTWTSCAKQHWLLLVRQVRDTGPDLDQITSRRSHYTLKHRGKDSSALSLPVNSPRVTWELGWGEGGVVGTASLTQHQRNTPRVEGREGLWGLHHSHNTNETPPGGGEGGVVGTVSFTQHQRNTTPPPPRGGEGGEEHSTTTDLITPGRNLLIWPSVILSRSAW